MHISRLNEALGAEITGVDVSRELTPDTAQVLHEAFLEHHLLCFRAEPLTPAAFAKLARRFGTPQLQLLRKQRDEEVPEVSTLESTYHRPEDKPDDLTRVRLSGWHTDDSYFAKPAKATMLQSLAVPSEGGQTRFCNMRLAWEELPAELKARIESRRAVHSYDTRRAPARAPERSTTEKVETPDVVHPLVRTHEDTGKKAIYFNPNRTDRLLDLDRESSDEILDALYAHATQPKYQYHHEWRLGDILLWDNRCLLHSVNTDFPVGETRRHQRILLEGAAPV